MINRQYKLAPSFIFKKLVMTTMNYKINRFSKVNRLEIPQSSFLLGSLYKLLHDFGPFVSYSAPQWGLHRVLHLQQLVVKVLVSSVPRSIQWPPMGSRKGRYSVDAKCANGV